MPPLIWREAFRSKANLCRHTELELVIGDLKERKKLADEDPNVTLIDQGVRQLECTTANGNISISQTIKDNVTVSLNRIGVNGNHLV